MASRKSLCPDCLLPPSECLGHDDEPDEPGQGECDAAEFGAAATFLPGGTCRCIVCPRCGHHTGNAHQGHFWGLCKVLLGRARDSLPPGETLSLDELLTPEDAVTADVVALAGEDGEPLDAASRRLPAFLDGEPVTVALRYEVASMRIRAAGH